ncbi:RNA polymerase subunit sigma-70 [Prevotella sp. P4-51]|uniref:RNA polymerase sigma factor n=1 Tax=Prevotella sp. P4-51 TaxID=2024228 RepID=UPI000B9740FB|nr:sigma-70 family RNA polymerase sigma factor [Prevotella sp. P4-51]OYP76115.1 RNA polymerase subunit sigma-70 [Prevotella sp. P4-51]
MNPKEQQFAQVVKDNRSTIYVVCYMFSNDAEEVADLFQEVLVKLWNGYDSFQGKSDIKTWIYRVTLNTCVTIDRKKRRRNRAMLSMDVDYFDSQEQETAQVRILHERIARLQPLDRAIILLWLEQISYGEIGEIVGISAKNVSVRLARIRVQLKNMSNE